VTAGSDLQKLTLTFDVKVDELEDDYKPLAVGEKIVFPYDYLTVEFRSLSKVTYESVKVSFDDMDAKDDLLVDSNVAVIETDEDIIMIDNEEVDKIYITDLNEFYYYNEDKDFTKSATAIATIENKDFDLEVTYVAGKLKFKDLDGKVVELDSDIANQRLGAVEEDAEAADVRYEGTNFGTSEFDVLTYSGLVIRSVEANADNDEAVFSIPSDVVEASVLVY